MKLRYAAIVLPLALASSLTFATAPAATNAPANNHMMMKHQMMANHSMMSIMHALKMVEKAGYKNIWKIELENKMYHVKGYDAQGHKVKLRVDPMTGAITMAKSMF